MKNYRSTAVGFAVLTILLTAGAAQGLSGSNTVFTDDIVDKNVTNADLGTNSVTGSKVAPNSLTGSDINESTLVPSCPNAMSSVADICFTTPTRDAATFANALNDCLDEHLRLPSISETRMVAIAVNEGAGFLTDVFYANGAVAEVVVANNVGVSKDLASTARNYRCVTTVGARP